MSCGLGVSCPLTVESACYCCRDAAQQNVIGLWWVVGRSSTAILIKTGVKTICAIKLLKTVRTMMKVAVLLSDTVCAIVFISVVGISKAQALNRGLSTRVCWDYN